MHNQIGLSQNQAAFIKSEELEFHFQGLTMIYQRRLNHFCIAVQICNLHARLLIL